MTLPTRPGVSRSAFLAAALLAADLAFSAPAGSLVPIRYDDCGVLGRQPHVVNGGMWTFGEADVTAPLSARTVAFSSPDLLMHYDGLVPMARYALRVVYCTERANPRTQTLYANEAQVHGPPDLPRGEARTFDYDLPDGLAAKGVLDLSFRLVSGHNAEVSEVWLLSDVPQPVLDLTVTTDGLRTVATVSDELLRPKPGAAVGLALPDGDTLSATTGADGTANFDLAARLSPSAAGDITIAARADGLSKTPFYATYNVGPYTFAPHKVVWREQAAWLTCAVVSDFDGGMVVPDHRLMLSPFERADEAHFVCACLNNDIAQFLVKSYAIETSVSTHVFSYLSVPRFDPSDSVHLGLSQCSVRAHEAASHHDTESVAEIEYGVDKLAARLWNVSDSEMKAIQASLAEIRREVQPRLPMYGAEHD